MKDTAPRGLGILAIALLVGIVAAGVAFVMFDYTWLWSLFIGAILAVITAIFLLFGWREPLPKAGEGETGIRTAGSAGVEAGSAGVGAGTAGVGAGTAGVANAEGGTAGSADAGNAGTGATAGLSAAAVASADDGAMTSAATGAATADTSTATAAADTNVMKSTSVLPGEEDLASKNGSWSYDGDAEKSAATGLDADTAVAGDTGSEDAGAAAVAGSVGDAVADAGAATGAAAEVGSAGGADAGAGAETGASAGVGSDGDAGAGADAETGTAAEVGSAGGASAGADAETSVAGDVGSAVDAETGSDVVAEKPTFMTEAREGGPDDLKQIKGVGPKLEKTLHGMGIFHFDQIAVWGPPEQAWIDDNLEGFKGRATRDDWVGQAKLLAAGEATEFSNKVKKGGVY